MKARAFLKGFSLVELMVVIAIVALLAAVAVPFYREYSNKSKLKEVDAAVGEQLNMWVEQNALGTTPDNLSGANTGSEYIKSISFSRDGSGGGNVVVVLEGSKLPFMGNDNVVETWTAATDNNVTTWTCTYSGSTDYSTYITNCDLADQGDNGNSNAGDNTLGANTPAEGQVDEAANQQAANDTDSEPAAPEQAQPANA